MGSTIAAAVSATVAITLGSTGPTVAITLGPTGITVAVTLRSARPTFAVAVRCNGHTLAISIGYSSTTVAAWRAAVVADYATVGKLHWAVAVTLSIQPLQREHVAVSVVSFVDTAPYARLLNRALFPAVITRIHTPIASAFGTITPDVSPIAPPLGAIASPNRTISGSIGPVPASTALPTRLIAAATITAWRTAPISPTVALLVAPRPTAPRLL
jgi:hypothetical protein